jgi:hypothetical protein
VDLISKKSLFPKKELFLKGIQRSFDRSSNCANLCESENKRYSFFAEDLIAKGESPNRK